MKRHGRSNEAALDTDLTWRSLARADLPALSALLTAIETVDEPHERHHGADLVTAYERPDQDPAQHTLVAWAGDMPVGYAWNVPLETGADQGSAPQRVWLRGGVHPGWRRRGLGRRLLVWQIERARSRHTATAPLWLLGYVDQRHLDQAALLRGHGFTAERWYLDLSRAVRPVPLCEPPDGVVLRPYDGDWREPVRIAHNAAFAGHGDARPITSEQWLAAGSRPTFRRAWSWVATVDDPREPDTAMVVGYAMNSAPETDPEAPREGWTDRLGVVPAWRGRGIARALLARSLQSFADAGLAIAGLGVDTDPHERWVGLYQRLGYTVSDHMVRDLLAETPVSSA